MRTDVPPEVSRRAWVARRFESPVHLPGYTLLLPPARSARRWARHHRQLRALEGAYPAITRSLGLDPGWRVHRVVPTVGDVTVALVGGAVPAAVLKYARSAQGSAGLERSGTAVDALVSDPRLADWAGVLPRRLGAARTPEGHLAVLEQLLPGEDGRTCLTARSRGDVVRSVLGCVSTLHERTATESSIDSGLLQQWVDGPVALLTQWYDAAGTSRTPALERLRDELHGALRGREVTTGWIHGDLAPGNVLLRPGPLRVSGLLDWERASDAGLLEVDVVHLHLTTSMLAQGRELGDLVCELLRRPSSSASGGAETDPVLVLLTWLHHVSGLVAKSDRYAVRGAWAARNVDPVLTAVGATGVAAGDAGPPRVRGASWER